MSCVLLLFLTYSHLASWSRYVTKLWFTAGVCALYYEHYFASNTKKANLEKL